MESQKKSNLFVPFRRSGEIDTDSLSASYVILSTIEDRLAGVTITEQIWDGLTFNSAYVTRAMSTSDVRASVEKFFATRRLRGVLRDVIKTQTVRTPYRAASLADYLAGLEAATDAATAGVLLEMLLPGLVANDLVEGPANRPSVMNRFVIPFVRTPSLDDIVAETMRQELERAVKECTVGFKLEKGTSYAAVALADVMAEAYFPLFLKLRTSFDYTLVIEDIVKGVLVNLDPQSIDAVGDIQSAIFNHDVVRTLATNWTFVRAALELRAEMANSSGTITLATNCDAFKFDRLAPVVLAMLKTSDRYAVRGRTDVLTNYGLRHVSDITDVRRAAVLFEHAKMDPVSLAVVTFDDPVMPDAINVQHSGGQFDAQVAAAYGNTPAAITPQAAVNVLCEVLSHCVEAGHDDEDTISGVFMATVREITVEDAALLLSDAIMFNPAQPDKVVYRLRTDATFPNGIDSGIIVRGEVYTTDPAEVLLCHPAFDAKSTSEVLPQLLPRAAMGAYLFSDKLHIIAAANKRYAFNTKIGSTALRGGLRWSELQSARADQHAALIRPTYNAAVFASVESIMAWAADVIIANAPDDIKRQLRRMLAVATIDMARAVSPAFRQMVHNIISLRSKSRLPQEQINEMSARLNSNAVKAYVDLYAAAFFFAIQGIGALEDVRDDVDFAKMTEDEIIAAMAEAEESRTNVGRLFARVWRENSYAYIMAEQGSDRKAD